MYIILILFIIIIFICKRFLTENYKFDTYVKLENSKLQLKHNGFMIINQLLDNSTLNKLNILWEKQEYTLIKKFFIKHKKLVLSKIKNILGNDYKLLDYSYLINGTTIHTFHRDYTSSKESNNLSYPSYTLILYLNKSEVGLSVIPTSHRTNRWFYLSNNKMNLTPNPGEAILFNANLLHSGSLTSKDNIKRHCIQFKITHKNDLIGLKHLDKKHAIISRKNTKQYIYKYIEHDFTARCPILFDLFQNEIKTSFDKKKTPLQKIVSKIIFSSEKFYKPKTI